MRKKSFFDNLGAILAYALIGTIISTAVIAIVVYGFAQFITHTVAFKFLDLVYLEESSQGVVVCIMEMHYKLSNSNFL